MAEGSQDTSGNTKGWTSTQACVMAVICLFIGVAVGHLLRGSAGTKVPASAATGGATASISQAPETGGATQQTTADQQTADQQIAAQQITAAQLKQMADTQAAPLIERLKSDPKDANALADVGNLYFDSQQYQLARDYYRRSLEIRPANTNVRTDLGICLWYLGDPDGAIEQFDTVLKAEPTKPNALMDLGVVQWQGKMNIPAAIAAWEKLLATNPDFEGRDRVKQLIAQAKRHLNVQPGAKGGKPSM